MEGLMGVERAQVASACLGAFCGGDGGGGGSLANNRTTRRPRRQPFHRHLPRKPARDGYRIHDARQSRLPREIGRRMLITVPPRPSPLLPQLDANALRPRIRAILASADLETVCVQPSFTCSWRREWRQHAAGPSAACREARGSTRALWRGRSQADPYTPDPPLFVRRRSSAKQVRKRLCAEKPRLDEDDVKAAKAEIDEVVRVFLILRRPDSLPARCGRA
jgi:hypothetical protein